jgi:hypothetical protein
LNLFRTVFQPREAKPVQRFAAVAKEEDLDDEEVLGEIIYRNPVRKLITECVPSFPPPDSSQE